MNCTNFVLIGLALWFLYAVVGYIQLRFVRRKILENWNLRAMSCEDLALAMTVWDHRAMYPIRMKLIVISNVLFWWFGIGARTPDQLPEGSNLLIAICYMPEEYQPVSKPILVPSAL